MNKLNPEEVVRRMIAHENDLTNHRLSWLNTIQGFLFAALGFAWEEKGNLTYVLALIGALVAGSSFIGLFCSHKALARLRRRWKQDMSKTGETSSLDVFGYWDDRLGRLGPWSTLPIVFVLGWVLVALLRIW